MAKKAARKSPRKTGGEVRRGRGNPTTFREDIADMICEHVAAGKSVRSFCREHDMPTSTVFRWLQDQPEFLERYTHARHCQAESLAEEILEIADDGSNDTYLDSEGNRRTDHDVVNRSRLRVDARKWLLAKLHPAKFGDKIEASAKIEHTHKMYGQSAPVDEV